MWAALTGASPCPESLPSPAQWYAFLCASRARANVKSSAREDIYFVYHLRQLQKQHFDRWTCGTYVSILWIASEPTHEAARLELKALTLNQGFNNQCSTVSSSPNCSSNFKPASPISSYTCENKGPEGVCKSSHQSERCSGVYLSLLWIRKNSVRVVDLFELQTMQHKLCCELFLIFRSKVIWEDGTFPVFGDPHMKTKLPINPTQIYLQVIENKYLYVVCLILR